MPINNQNSFLNPLSLFTKKGDGSGAAGAVPFFAHLPPPLAGNFPPMALPPFPRPAGMCYTKAAKEERREGHAV